MPTINNCSLSLKKDVDFDYVQTQLAKMAIYNDTLNTVIGEVSVEQTVLRQLQKRGKVTFTDIWEAVSIAFPNSLTSDQTSIKESLEIYASKVQKGSWLLKENFVIKAAEKEHTTIIALLAEIGLNNGYKIHIGKIEQNHRLNTDLLKKSGPLKNYMNYKSIFTLNDISNFETVGDIDLIWVKDDSIKYIFEIECTTSMISALHRGSNVLQSVSKIMLIPIDRFKQFQNKMKSPMFFERFNNDNWKIIIFDVLYKAWFVNGKRTDIEELFNKPTTLKQSKKDKEKKQLTLFEDDN